MQPSKATIMDKENDLYYEYLDTENSKKVTSYSFPYPSPCYSIGGVS